jgi:hypothetical protein
MRTFRPLLAKAVDRLMQVVVLPQPPFWLAITMIDVLVLALERDEGDTPIPSAGVFASLWFLFLLNSDSKYSSILADFL